MDLGALKSVDDFFGYVQQVAIVTATSHVRGGVGKAPVQFKEVITSVLGPKPARAAWGTSVAHTARNYRQQVLEDFKCFRKWVRSNFTDTS